MKAKKLPKSLYKFFWDVDVTKLDLDDKRYFVIQRLLDKGNLEAVRWVRKNYSNQDITAAFYQLRDFRTKIGRFWTLFLNLDQSKVICIQPHYLKMRKSHWPF